jgi:hypothetical protein
LTSFVWNVPSFRKKFWQKGKYSMNEAIDWLRFAREDLRVAEWAVSDQIYNRLIGAIPS